MEEAIRRVPRHLMARAGLNLLGQPAEPDRAAPNANAVDAALARAVLLVANGDAIGAARLVDAALAAAPPGHAGWLIPIEPLVNVQRDRAAWTAVLAWLRTRAS